MHVVAISKTRSGVSATRVLERVGWGVYRAVDNTRMQECRRQDNEQLRQRDTLMHVKAEKKDESKNTQQRDPPPAPAFFPLTQKKTNYTLHARL